MMAMSMGLHPRCGIEDTIIDQHGNRFTSVQQIEQCVRVARELGREIATGKEAREIYRIGAWYDSVDETLQNNGMPPNPTEFNPGFLTWPTDGKIKPAVLGGDSHPIAACMIAPEPVRAAQAKLMAARK